MSEARLLQSNMTGGELSPRLSAHADLGRYQNGLETAANLIVHPLGGVSSRAGSVWAADPAVVDAPARVLPFVRGIGDAVMVIVQRSKLRFIDVQTRSYILSSGSPYEKACPWSDADLPYLVTWQSADVLYIADARMTAPVRALKRFAAADWALDELTLAEGPFLPDFSGVTLTASNAQGTTTLTATLPIFEAGHVGALVRIRQNTGSPPNKRWEAGAAVLMNELRVNAGRVYLATGAGTTGNNSPVHDRGAVSDGAVTWDFHHDGAGIARITGFTSPTVVTATVISNILPALSTQVFALGAFSGPAGYPACGGIHQERFALAGATITPDTAYLSRVGGYGPYAADFKPGLGTGQVVDSDAVTRTLASGRVEPICHLVSAERLYAFSTRGVHVIGGPSIEEPITPSAASARMRSSYGCAREVAPARLGDSIMYVTRGRQMLRELIADERDTREVSLIAEHIASRGMAELAVLESPRPLMMLRLDDGGVGALTFESVEQVIAWTPQSFSGVVESEAAAPKADGRDELWMIVRRTIDGVERRAIEIMGQPWDARRTPLELAPCVDSAGFLDLWNTTGTTAKILVLDDAQRRGAVETSANAFSAGDVGKTIALRKAPPLPGRDPGPDAAIARLKVDTYVSATRVEGQIVTDGPPALIGVMTTLWAKMTSTLTGLARLNGHTIDALGDGVPMQGLIVTAGAVTLPAPVARAWAGLPFVVELADMPPSEGAAEGTSLAKRKRVEEVWIVAEHLDAATELVSPHPSREPAPIVRRAATELAGLPPLARGGFLYALPPDGWDDRGVIRLRHASPTPFAVLGIVKRVKTG